MDADRARRAHAIFTAALDAAPELRDQAVSDACAGDAALESRVRRLLAAASRSTGFLETPALARLPDAQFALPDAVGNYLVTGVLGVGGMATVYEAVQENPSRRVALKVMHHGMAHTDAYLRFRLETETLARLHHPGIAQIYEAGAAQLGQPAATPFFAMELVEDARTITQYATREALPLRRRLQMFAAVCDAVLHGHQNGVIHRDLKPGNVLVGSDGRAKVIDFGIARSIEGSPGGAAPLTAQSDARRLIGTLNYMSPEQCTEPGTIDVRSDVYSLGVMLYELVTGRLPHDLSKCSIPEAVRIITQESPPRAGALCREASGDLDAIIARAMEKDRAARYSGAGALAADVRRWLDGRPVEARPVSALASAWKFARRNRALTTAVGALALTLIGGAALAGRLAYLATRARDEALQRERELETITEFQEGLLRGLDVSAMGDLLRQALAESLKATADNATPADAPPDALRAAESLLGRVNFTTLALHNLNESVLQRYAAAINTRFADQPILRARLLQQLASTLNSLGLHKDAEPAIREALDIRTRLLGDEHPDTLLSAHSLGSLLSTLGRHADAIALLRATDERRTRRLGPEHPSTRQTRSSLGGAYRRGGDLPAAERTWFDLLALQRRLLGDDNPETLRTLSNLGVAYAAQDKPDQAEACWRELLERRRRLLGELHPEYLSALGNLGVLLQDQGRFADARPLLEQALAADRRRFGDLHTTTLISMSQLAALLAESGDPAGAEPLLRECLRGRLKALGPEHTLTLRTMVTLASVLHTLGNDDEAMQLAKTASEIQRRTLGGEHPDTLDSLNLQHQIAAAASRPAAASAPATPPER